jgi:hypothetical protein
LISSKNIGRSWTPRGEAAAPYPDTGQDTMVACVKNGLDEVSKKLDDCNIGWLKELVDEGLGEQSCPERLAQRLFYQ